MMNEQLELPGVPRRGRDKLADVLKVLGLSNPINPHSAETPRRLWEYLFLLSMARGDSHLPALKSFESTVDEMVVVPHISFWSACSHHLLPFFGTMTFAYLPDGRIVGLSKVTQFIRAYASGPWVQEELVAELADFFYQTPELKPKGVGLYARATHTCQFKSVGPNPPQLICTALRGVFMKGRVRDEFLRGVE